jgi:hypothetical protein
MCELCGSWSVLSGVAILIVFIAVVFAAMNITKWYGATATLQALIQTMNDFNIPELSKVWVSMIQILGALPKVLSLTLPQSFKLFLLAIGRYIPFLHFDITLFGVGCLTRGLYLPMLFANLLMVGMIRGEVVLVSRYDLWKAHGSFSEERLRTLFEKFDTSGDAVIGHEELAQIIGEMDPTADPATVASMFADADKDGGGQISFEEFADAVIGVTDKSSKSKSTKSKSSADGGHSLAKVAIAKAMAMAKATAIGHTFLLIFLVYPPETNNIFEAFHCREIGPGVAVLIVDHTVLCQDGGAITVEYAAISSFASLCVLAWPIGMPALLFFFMWRARPKIFAGDEDTLKLFDFVIGDYTAQCWYWELVELGRKLVLAGLIGMLGRGTVGQIVVAQFVSFFFFALQIWAQPFKESMLNWVKAFSEFVIFGVLLVATVQQVHATEFEADPDFPDMSIEDYGRFQAGLCLALLPVTVFFMFTHIRDLKQEARDLRSGGDNPSKESDSNTFAEMDNPIADLDSADDLE